MRRGSAPTPPWSSCTPAEHAVAIGRWGALRGRRPCSRPARARRGRRRSPCTDAGGSPPDAPADSLRVLASPPGGLVRCTPFLALVIAAGCARPPRAAAPRQPGLFGPSSQPVLLPPLLSDPDVPRTGCEGGPNKI